MDWLLVNTVSGSGRAKRSLETVRARLKEHSITPAEKMAGTIPEIQDIATKAVLSRIDRLWVLGGDGTLSAVAGSLCYSQTTLCPLPGGTAGVFCKELSVPDDAAQAVSALLAGGQILIDLGQIVDGKPLASPPPSDPPPSIKFLLMASVGIDAQVVRDVNLNLKQVLGPLAYVIEGALKFFSFPSARLLITDEHGIERVGYHLLVQNSRLYGGEILMAPKAKIDDGRFDVILIKKPGRLALLRFLFAIPTGSHTRLPYVEYFRTTTLQVHGEERNTLQADGDCMTQLPVKISVLPKALRVLAPKVAPGAA